MDITELARQINSLNAELKNLDGLIAFEIFPCDQKIQVFMTELEFLTTFPEHQTLEKRCDTFPFELFTVVEGVRFFTISKSRSKKVLKEAV